MAEKGEDSPIRPEDFPPPIQYTLLKYRREMHMSYQEVMDLPLTIYENDIEMMNLENEYRHRRQPQAGV